MKHQQEWRLGRLTYFGVLVAHFCVSFVLGIWLSDAYNDRDFEGFNVRLMYVLASLPVAFVVVRARLRDMGESPGGWAMGTLLPIYNLYFGLRMLFTKGKAEPIQRGQNKDLGVALVGAFFMEALLAVFGTSMLPLKHKSISPPVVTQHYKSPPDELPPVIPGRQCSTTRECQTFLHDFGYPIIIDGKWGPASQAAWNRCAVDGRCKPMGHDLTQ